jgi:multicomponent Na+:H+ antiporter subunit D
MSTVIVLLPILLPLLGAALNLLLYNQPRPRGYVALSVMVISLASSVYLLARVWQGGAPLIFQLGGWQAPFGITLVADMLSATMTLMSQIVISAGILYALGSRDQCVRYPAFYSLFLTLATGLTGAFLTGDIFNLFVFAELLVVSGTVLTAISDDKFGTEAAYKYFYISLFASMFLLIASGLLYASYGTLNMADLAARIAANPNQPLMPVAMVFLLAFFMVKSAVIPFHFWQPDFHTAAPTAVSALLSSVVVKLGIYGFLRMTTLIFVEQAQVLQTALMIFGLIGIFFGGLGAIGTFNAKRMLAYSTLAQMGFILVAIGWGTPLALTAAVVYIFNHSLIKAALLMLAGTVASRAPVKSAAFQEITGVGKSMPYAGALFLLGGMALAGIPPLNGFISKMTLFQSGFNAQSYISLAAIGFASLFTLIYIGRAFQKIWWEPMISGGELKPYGDSLIAPGILIGLCLALGLWSEPLLLLAMDVAAWLGDAQAYIQAVLVSLG